ncbi:rod shape-determining protein MreD [Geobacter sulfurreducens]|jgi:rod shape-determining protein MreD|uniref:Cell shape-determining protein MreD, putative n=1 Tax=Geobacter sulfurreducens (strain ATCC 51573 / DSM 12127 / PCA) TaxID=243231 RepID=Q74BG1_GEOSL|nr:rod shape-determining protein MreD [Geobacter sulfurreducens]AAR35456.1 cell shape-determining protein MreD, putative [Geobacter sulfurreducens PCA]ADI84914.1 cell shape-determining protein MreD, putative [Geobacter sulfurreducens KN400]AJY68303.1 rod shape-determining protein MreD [Geobacter sulfurreducens]UAC02807.1 rod shape-determining protein MreD [Geobacter sulfurreducens]UTG91532.1 rod shape-determining protein MreD [Geobacter sulfurreducens]
MIKLIWYAILVFAAIILQVSVIPTHIADPFKPNLLILFVVFMGLREELGWGVLAFVLGLLHDSFSGLYLGLNAFSYLVIFLLFSLVAGRLYTDRRSLMILGTFSATMVSGLFSLLLLLLFSSSHGIYASLLEGLVPQSLVNALVASIVFTFTPLARLGDIR